MKPDARVLVVLPNWLGDAVMSLPALGDVRDAFAAGVLTVAARAPVAPLFPLVGGVDEVVTLTRGRAAVRENAIALGGGRFDVAILLPNSFSSAWMTYRAQIAERWGYRADWRSRWLTRGVPRPSGGHQVAYYRDLVRALDIPPAREPLTIRVPDDQMNRARGMLTASGWTGGRVVGIAPGAAYGKAKQWPPEYFAALIENLQEHEDATIALLGSSSDQQAAHEILRCLRTRTPRPSREPINLMGRTDLAALAATLSICAGFVSNDSGAMHLAAALGVPVTALFGPTNERETAPRPAPGARPPHLLTHDVFCRPCMLRECPIDHRCMRGIEPAIVAAACRDAMTA